MGWVFHGIDQESFTREYNDLDLFKLILKFTLPFKGPFILTLFALVSQSIIILIAPLAFTQTFNIYEQKGNLGLILYWGFIYLALNLLVFVFYFLMMFGQSKLIPNFMVNLRTTIFNHFQELDMKFFDDKRSGNLSNRVGGDAANSNEIIGLLYTLTGNLILILFSVVILYFISSFLTTIIVISAILVILISLTFRRLARNNARIVRKTESNITSSIAESVESIQIAKSYGRHETVISNFEKLNRENYSAGLKLNLVMMTLFPTIDFFSALTTWFILNYGGQSILLNQTGLTGETLYLFILYLNSFYFPLINISMFYSQLQTNLAALERIAIVLDSQPEIKWNETGLELEDIKGEIKFENVTFGYSKGGNVLENFNLTIKAGERLAIVGHTGAGKTSIINLIARFYEYQGGTIYIDGHDIRTLNLKSYLKNVGLVQQDPFLFSGSVKDNIRYGKFDATDDEIFTAINTVQAEEFIDTMPEGLDTEVRERGSRLSTGQRQLVCFARAILSNPKILILDEATSSVDAYTESVIQDALEKLMENRTSIVIAHRLSTVINADRILVLDNGKIIEEGTHAELLKQGNKYKELYDTYYKHQAVDLESIQYS